MIQTIDNDSMKSEMINDLSIDYILENNDYTVGCVLNHLLFTNYFTKEKTLQYCGFKKIHPHDTHSIIRMMFKDKDETESSASSSRASLKASMKKEEELVEETADYSPGYAESASSEPKESDANYSPPYSTTQAADYSPPYSTTEPANKPVPFSTVKKANDNYSPPYSTTEPGNQGNQMRGGNPVMYQRMGFGYIKQCCLEAIQVFDTILKTFDK
jgi:DNA-directed RNA polymerase subunit L